jgi:glycosyltransferase involved in cell wall biosynthesis
MLILTPKEMRDLKMAVRAAKLHEYLKKNHIRTILLFDFNMRTISVTMMVNYLKLLYFIITRRYKDCVLIENERSERLLSFLKKLRFRIALDIRDNRALQRSAYQLDDSPGKIDTIQRVLLKNIEMSDYVFTVTQSCKELYPKKFLGKFFIVENASDPFLFEFSDLPENLRVGFISGISPGRGIELLIEAMRLVKEKVSAVTLSIAGNAAIDHKEGIDYYSRLKKQFESNWISFRDDIFYSINAGQFLKGCYLTVIPHPDHIYYHTTLPVKLFDSLSCGRPVVATKCRETANILRHYDCGLVADFSARDLAEKILRLLLDKKLASRMGANGRKVIEEIYNWDNMAKKIMAIVGQ